MAPFIVKQYLRVTVLIFICIDDHPRPRVWRENHALTNLYFHKFFQQGSWHKVRLHKVIIIDNSIMVKFLFWPLKLLVTVCEPANRLGNQFKHQIPTSNPLTKARIDHLLLTVGIRPEYVYHIKHCAESIKFTRNLYVGIIWVGRENHDKFSNKKLDLQDLN